MSNNPEVLLNRIAERLNRVVVPGVGKLDIKTTRGFELAPRTGRLVEHNRLFVGPSDTTLNLERPAFRNVLELLRPPDLSPEVITDSGWHGVRKPGVSGEVEAFHFGTLNYSGNAFDILNPKDPTYRRFLVQNGLEGLRTQGREVLYTVQLYPNSLYSRVMHGYNAALIHGKEPDPTLDFLTHDITRAQFADLSEKSGDPLIRMLIDKGYMTWDYWINFYATAVIEPW